MTSRITQDTGRGELGFPKLLTGEDGGGTVIVLFFNECTGTVVHSNKGSPVGYSSRTWTMVNFTDFHGTVELRND